MVCRSSLNHIGFLLSAVLSTALFAACMTTKVVTSPGEMVDFKHYQRVKVVTLNLVGTAYSGEGVPLFEARLKDWFQSHGYSVVDNEEEMRIEIILSEFQPGHRWLGWIVGIGELAARLRYLARFKDRSGVLAAFEGGKSYHGWEIIESPRFMTGAELRMSMVRHAVVQLGEFIQSNGRRESHGD